MKMFTTDMLTLYVGVCMCVCVFVFVCLFVCLFVCVSIGIQNGINFPHLALSGKSSMACLPPSIIPNRVTTMVMRNGTTALNLREKEKM